MKSSIKQIKIKLNVPETIIAYFRLQEKWENEGGAIRIMSKDDLIPDEKIPFAPGELFRVLSASIELIDDTFYYIVNVETVPEGSEKVIES